MKTIWWFKFIIPRFSYYFEFIGFVLFSYIFLHVINRYKFIAQIYVVHSFCCFLCSWISLPGYIWRTIVQSLFLVYSQLKIHCFLWEIQLMLQTLLSIFRSIKIKIKGFRISYRNHIFFHSYKIAVNLFDDFIMLIQKIKYLSDLMF